MKHPQDLALLILRVVFAGVMWNHGWGKVMGFSEYSMGFPDPLGVGHQASLILAIFAEVFCSVLVVLGIGTRLAAIPLAITMAVAGLIVHASDPWQKKELAFLYLAVFIALAIAGGGKYSLGHFNIMKKLSKWS